MYRRKQAASAALAAVLVTFAAACGGSGGNPSVSDAATDAVVDSAPSCGTSETLCGDTCVDVLANADHCGTCDNACTAPDVCSAGACALTCPATQDACDGACFDLQTSGANCGACGTTCGAGEACVAGACALSCETGLDDCSGSCRDLQTDLANCGACGTTCAAGEVCSAGACALSCETGLDDCSGSCRDLQTDRANCGACGTTCGAGEVCSAGACALSCETGLDDCSGSCRDLQTDLANCGACGTTCGAGEVCSAGACALSCETGLDVCGGSCRDLQTDLANCGACGTTCAAGEVCSAGACALSCETGLDDCSGSCRDLQTDLANCGACGTTCGAGEVCSAGACALSCETGLDDCGGSCRDLQTDLANCGACGTTCGAGEVCSAGACALSCETGLDVCGGSCRDLQTDRANCGACGTTCTDAEFCEMGACITACSPTLPNRCGGVCTDSRVDEANCGGCGTVCATDEFCLAGSCGLPASCAEILASDPSVPDGEYLIDPDGASAIAPLLVHCDMSSDGGVGYTMVRIDDPTLGGTQGAYAAVCAAVGMEIIVPRTRAHANAIRVFNGGSPPNLVNVFPKTNGAAGLANWEGECQGTRGCSFYLSNSGNAGCLRFEPSGDNNTANRLYLANSTVCDYGQWNDRNDFVFIHNYVICSPNDVGPALAPTCNDYLLNDSVSNVSRHGIDGVYTIDPAGDGTGFRVQCDMTNGGGGWTLGFIKNSVDQATYGNFGAADTNLAALATWPASASSAAPSTAAHAGWVNLNTFPYTTLRFTAYLDGRQTYVSSDILRTELRINFGQPGYLLWGPENANAYYWCGGPHSYTDLGMGQVNRPTGAPAGCKVHVSLGSGWDFSLSNSTNNAGLTMCGSDQSNFMFGHFGSGPAYHYPNPGAAQAIWVR